MFASSSGGGGQVLPVAGSSNKSDIDSCSLCSTTGHSVGSCYFCGAAVDCSNSVHDHVKEKHPVEYIFLAGMAMDMNTKVATKKPAAFWLQVAFVKSSEKRGEGAIIEMPFLLKKMEQLVQSVNSKPTVQLGPQKAANQAVPLQFSFQELQASLFNGSQLPPSPLHPSFPSPIPHSPLIVPTAATQQTFFNGTQPSTSSQYPVNPSTIAPVQQVGTDGQSLVARQLFTPIDLGNGVVAMLLNSNEPNNNVDSSSTQLNAPLLSLASTSTSVIHSTRSDEESRICDGMESIVSSTAPTVPNVTPSESKQHDVVDTTVQRFMPTCSPLNPGQIAALMGTPLVSSADCNQDTMQRIVEMQMSYGMNGAAQPNELNPGQLAALMGTPLVYGSDSSEEEMQSIVEQQMSSSGRDSTLLNGPYPQSSITASQMAALMGTPLLPSVDCSNAEALQQLVELQMSSSAASNGFPRMMNLGQMAALYGIPILPSTSQGPLEEQQMSANPSSSGSASSDGFSSPLESRSDERELSVTPPMLNASAGDEAMIGGGSPEERNMPSLPREVTPPKNPALADNPTVIVHNNQQLLGRTAVEHSGNGRIVSMSSQESFEMVAPSTSAALSESRLSAALRLASAAADSEEADAAMITSLLNQTNASTSKDATVFKVPKLPRQRPSTSKSGAPPAKRARRKSNTKGTVLDPSVADVLKRIYSRPAHEWGIQGMMYGMSIKGETARGIMKNATRTGEVEEKRDNKNSTQLAIIITALLCMDSAADLEKSQELERSLIAEIRSCLYALPEEDQLLRMQLFLTKLDLNHKLYEPREKLGTIVEEVMSEAIQIASTLWMFVPHFWAESLGFTLNRLIATLLYLINQHRDLGKKLMLLNNMLKAHILTRISDDPKYQAQVETMARQLYGPTIELNMPVKPRARTQLRPTETDVMLQAISAGPYDLSFMGQFECAGTVLGRLASTSGVDDVDKAVSTSSDGDGDVIIHSTTTPSQADELASQSTNDIVSAMVASIMKLSKEAEEAAASLADYSPCTSPRSNGHDTADNETNATTAKTSPTPASSAPNTPPGTTKPAVESSQSQSDSTASENLSPAERESVIDKLAHAPATAKLDDSPVANPVLRPFLPYAEAEHEYAEDRRIWLQKENKVSCRYGCSIRATSSGMVSHYRRFHYDVYFQAVHKACKEMSVKRWLAVRFGDEKDGKEGKQDKRACIACHSELKPSKPDYYDRMHLATHFKQSHLAYFNLIREDYFKIFNGLIEDDPVVHFLLETQAVEEMEQEVE